MRLHLHRIAVLALCLWVERASHGEETASFSGELALVRYDMPIGLSTGLAPTRQVARRDVDAADGVDWPDFTLAGRPVFRDGAEERVALKLRSGAEAASPFQMPGDDVIQPGNHWLRAMEWRGARKHIYTADPVARGGPSLAADGGCYELWVFPILINGEGAPVVKNVELKAGGTVLYHRAGPWRSLTLLLPQNETGVPYELSVDGRPPVKFDAGLQPVVLGSPREVAIPVSAAIGGAGPRITVQNRARPETFPNPTEWAADVAALGKARAAEPVFERAPGLQRYLGAEVPRSPLTIYAAGLPHGKSGGFLVKGESADAFADRIVSAGYDTAFEPVRTLPAADAADSLERRASQFAQRGLRLGFQYDNNWNRPALQHPGVALFAHTLPDWHAPLYRSLSIAAQRFARLPNFAGIGIGADNAGYLSYWSWAPPNPDRPWGEAMTAFIGSPQPRIPRPPSLGPRELPYEEPVASQAEFVKYVEHYDTTFHQYGYFADAVRAVDPALVFTTGSFGSSPGAGGRGGWPWASIPGRVMFADLNTQQAYDWNELHSSKPMHNVALVDRLRSYSPKKRTWTIIDNFRLLFCREAFQRACALALTRGVEGIGTNFLPTPDAPEAIGWQREMNDWMHRYGGVYARTEPQPVIGIFFSHLQSVQRRVIVDENAPGQALYAGSHEGKVTEALFLCHAAGWPARVITYEEVMRGPLPDSMRAVLLVGLNHFDDTWSWGPGLEKPLQQFIDRGGRILADDESTCAVPFSKTGMRIAAYMPQTNVDATPLLFSRNAANIATLRAAMNGIPAPIAVSDDPTLWAIPTQCGDTQYVTAVNQASADGDEAKEYVRPADPRASKPEVWKTKSNASIFVKPQTGALRWNTERPIYDVRLARKLSADEAAKVDLTRDAFRFYALPPAEITKPEISVAKGATPFYEAEVTMHGISGMAGIPVEITVTGPQEKASVFSTTGAVARLPLSESDAGDYLVTATELLTGLAESAHVVIRPQLTIGPPATVRVRDTAAVKQFARRKAVPLTIGLTPAQDRDPEIRAQLAVLKDFYQRQGRQVSFGSVDAGGIVESLQPLRSPNRYPQWKTVASDLILVGTAQDNVLLLDQARAGIFPRGLSIPKAGEADILYTRSPFVGECDSVNIVVSGAEGLRAAVERITSAR